MKKQTKFINPMIFFMFPSGPTLLAVPNIRACSTPRHRLRFVVCPQVLLCCASFYPYVLLVFDVFFPWVLFQLPPPKQQTRNLAGFWQAFGKFLESFGEAWGRFWTGIWGDLGGEFGTFSLDVSGKCWEGKNYLT